MLTNVTQWVLPGIPCGSYPNPFVVECKIQKSRLPRTDNVRGIYDATVTYKQNDVVYYGSPVAPYPGWRWKNSTPGNSTPALGSDWEYASNFDFTQASNTTVFYLDQQIISESGLGSIQRHVSRQEGKLTPDMRELSLLDCTKYSGHYGDNTTESGDLSSGIYRTLLSRIFEDPDALYTVYFSKVSGSNRELYFIGDVDFSKSTSEYNLDYAPGTTDALQKLLTKVQAEGWANRLNTFTVRDFILATTTSDVSGPMPFMGGYVSLGNPDYTFKDGYFYPSATWFVDVNSCVPPNFVGSRANTRSFPFIAFKGLLMPATCSINDNLHFISLSKILATMAALCNASTPNVQSLMSFWADVTDQTTGIISANSISFANIGVPYEYLFNIDPRCNFNVAEADMGGFSWDTSLSDILIWFCKALITYTQGTCDQTNKRGQLVLADSLSPSATPLPTNWKVGAKAGSRPRLVSAKCVKVQNRGDSDIIACPKNNSSALNIEIGPRVKKIANIGSAIGSVGVDIVYNGHLTQLEQSHCWNPLQGGLGDWGHICNTGDVEHLSDDGILDYWILVSTNVEFVVAQGTPGTISFYTKNDFYGVPTDYLNPDNPSGRADTIVFANGAYGALAYTINRNEIVFETIGAYTDPPTGAGVPFRVGYNLFRTDLTVTDGSQLVSCGVTADFQNFDCCGNPYLGQQVIIPARGVFTCIAVYPDTADIHTIKLDHEVEGDGTNLELRFGGPTINSESFILGAHLYYNNTTDRRFGAPMYGDDVDGGLGSAWLAKMFLSNKKTDADGNWHGACALSRMRYVDGAIYDGSTPPDDTYGNSLKTAAQCHASLNLGSYAVVSRPFVGQLTNGGAITGYNPNDTWSEHAQGADRNYRATGLNIDEKRGAVVAELLEYTSAPPLDNRHFPIRVVGAGSSGSSGSAGGSLGGSGGGGSSQPVPFGWASKPTSTQLIAGNNNNVDYTQGSLAVQGTLGSAATLTGIQNVGLGIYRAGLTIRNLSGYPLTIKNASGLSIAANQILTGVSTDIDISNGGGVTLVYDAGNSVWHVAAIDGKLWGYGLDAGAQKLTNLAPGVAGTDGANVSQLTGSGALLLEPMFVSQ